MTNKELEQGMKAIITCQKLVPEIQEAIKDGVKRERLMVLTGEFNIFINGQKEATTSKTKMEFKDSPQVVELIQKALNIENIGEKCLLVLHTNEHGRVDKYLEELKDKKNQHQKELDNFLPKKTTEEEE